MHTLFKRLIICLLCLSCNGLMATTITPQDVALVNRTLMQGLQTPAASHARTASPPQAMLLVSLGMPTLALREYAKQSHLLHVPLIIRGMYNGSIHATGKRLYAILHPKNHPPLQAGVQIDPIWFTRYGIHVVPTLVVSDGAVFDTLSGNIPLPALLHQVAKRSQHPGVRAVATRILGAAQ